ncbi:histidine kinase [Psychroserpens sp. MEBiC05023]
MDSLEYLKKTQKNNFILRLAIADDFRFNRDYINAKNAYLQLENDVLAKKPIDYTLLAIISWKSCQNISPKNFSFEESLKDLYKGLSYAEKSQVYKRITEYHSNLAFYNSSSANYEQSVFHNKKHYEFAKKDQDSIEMILALKKVMEDFNVTNNSESAIKIWNEIRPMFKKKLSDYPYPAHLLDFVVNGFIKTGQLDSAAYYNKRCFYFDSIEGNTFRSPYNKLNKGRILVALEEFTEAEKVLLSSYNESKGGNNNRIRAISASALAQIYLQKNQPSKALDILKPTYNTKAKIRNYYKSGMERLLSNAYEATNVLDSALFYRNKSEKTMELENRIVAEKQVALAKAELGINELLKENEDLTSTKINLDEQITKSTKAKNILTYALLAVIALTGFFLYHKNQKEKLRISQHREQLTNKERIALEAELNTIRSQMNPHFMFNSLNSINEFIQNDSSEDASNYLVKFSRLMRFTLNYSKRKFVTLEEELELLELYVELENLRFYNSIDFDLLISLDININKVLIPPMMIQPFVENAIWHGLMAKENNRKLSLRFSENEQNIICDIEDNGIGRRASAKQKAQRSNHKSQGIGLTQRRLELLKSIHGKEAKVEVTDLVVGNKASGTLVKVTLPKQQKA